MNTKEKDIDIILILETKLQYQKSKIERKNNTIKKLRKELVQNDINKDDTILKQKNIIDNLSAKISKLLRKLKKDKLNDNT